MTPCKDLKVINANIFPQLNCFLKENVKRYVDACLPASGDKMKKGGERKTLSSFSRREGIIRASVWIVPLCSGISPCFYYSSQMFITKLPPGKKKKVLRAEAPNTHFEEGKIP